jgi:hypothetical protein
MQYKKSTANVSFLDENELVSSFQANINDSDFFAVYNKMYQMIGTQTATSTQKSIAKLAKKNKIFWDMFFNDYVKNELGSLIVTVAETQRQDAIKLIRAIFDNPEYSGTGAPNFARLIQADLSKNYIELSQWKSLRIAQTETTKAYNLGSLEGAKSLNLPIKKVVNIIKE